MGQGEIFALFVVTLGPFKLLGPFAAQTQNLEPAMLRSVALRAFLLSLVVLGAGGYAGRELAAFWTISRPALLIATGMMLLNLGAMLVARRVMQGAALLALRLLAAVLGVLQVALAVEIILRALHELGIA